MTDIKPLTDADVEVERLRRLVYAPGQWRCAKCKFQLTQKNLNAANGTVTDRDGPGDTCPNCAAPLWQVTEREVANEMGRQVEELWVRATKAEGLVQDQAEALKAAREAMEGIFAITDRDHVAWDKAHAAVAKIDALTGGEVKDRATMKGETSATPIANPTHRHIKRGSTYTVERHGAEVQTSRPIVEGDTITVYVGTDCKAWARLDEEFNDGRFEAIGAPTAEAAEIDKAEFIERFIARMVDRIGPTFDDGTSVADYARQVATSAWDADWQREDGPETCADVNIEYMGEE